MLVGIAGKLFKVRGQMSRSFVYRCINYTTVEAYILMMCVVATLCLKKWCQIFRISWQSMNLLQKFDTTFFRDTAC